MKKSPNPGPVFIRWTLGAAMLIFVCSQWGCDVESETAADVHVGPQPADGTDTTASDQEGADDTSAWQPEQVLPGRDGDDASPADGPQTEDRVESTDLACPMSDCPVAIIDSPLGTELSPQTLAPLKADRSYSCKGPITRWQWTVEQPTGSTAGFLPSADFPNPRFLFDVAGTYTFHLTVYDRDGVPSCQEATRRIDVCPCEPGFSVELTWTTPGDSDETDTGPTAGSDLDLHLIHPNAPSDGAAQDADGDGLPDPYFDMPWDCHFLNPQPQWSPSEPHGPGNPSLDIDDSDGAGPEYINLNRPTQGTQYRVAVHYLSDHGYGPAVATVRIYMNSQLAYEISTTLAPRDLWCVAFVGWDTATIEPCTAPDGSQPWITADYPQDLSAANDAAVP